MTSLVLSANLRVTGVPHPKITVYEVMQSWLPFQLHGQYPAEGCASVLRHVELSTFSQISSRRW